MSEDKPEITPDEVRGIRRDLGLSQAEAGELFGGGPRAFGKYEAGTVKPAASLIKLLRLLHSNPAMIVSLEGRRSQPMPVPVTTRPFEVSGDHIAVLTERAMPLLLRRLLYAEAQANGLSCDGIHVADNIAVADGGEDGRITWENGPERTQFLPSRLCQFQLKAGSIGPAGAGKDVLTKSGAVKDMVHSALEENGQYAMLCSHRYTKKAVQERERAIREAVRGAGMTIRDDQVCFWDADQIAVWANRHPAVAIWLKEHTQAGAVGVFRSWVHWAGRAEHEDSPWVDDKRLPSLQARLLEVVAKPKGVVRVVGLSGIGKSRLVVEALSAGDESPNYLTDIVLYADESEVGDTAINNVVQGWADTGERAIVVVDRCSPESHETLAKMASRSSSRLSLVTIDNETPSGTPDKATVKIDPAPDSVVEKVINQVSPGLPSEDQRRLVAFSKGYPGIAIRIAQAWEESKPLAHSTDQHLADSFVLGRRSRDPELEISCAMLLATYGLVGLESPVDSQLEGIAARGRNLSAADLKAALSRLVDRGVAQRRGRFVTLQPRPIAMSLAEHQWREWRESDWDVVLAGDGNADLKVLAAKQLTLLNTTDVSKKVVARVCRIGGPFDSLQGVETAGHAEVLSYLAEIDSRVVVDQLERSLNRVGDLTAIKGRTRRHLVWALEKIAFAKDTFEEGARLLLRLAIAETEPHISNNATGQFKALFPMLAGNTAAGATSRFRMLDEAADTDDPMQLSTAVDALIVATKTGHFMRMVGAETHGSRPAMQEWHPDTRQEAREYIEGSVARLTRFAERSDEHGSAARAGLGQHFRGLISSGLIDIVETAVHQVTSPGGQWNEALKGLGHVLEYDVSESDYELTERVKKLIEYLQPRDLESRVRFFVTEMPWDYPSGEKLDFEVREQRKVEAVRDLAQELAKQPTSLERTLISISKGPQRMAAAFGEGIASSLKTPVDWLDRFIAAALAAPENDRNFDLLSGYLVGIASDHPSCVRDLKKRVADSRDLAPALPLICWRLGITSSDVALVVRALEAGLLAPWALMQWTAGGKLSEVPPPGVAPLFDAMLDHSAEAYFVAIDLMGMYAHGNSHLLDELRPQVRKVAENVSHWELSMAGPMGAHHFESIMTWMLRKGRDDKDARTTALTLATAIAESDDRNDERIVEPVLPLLLSEFPEISWPVIGQAIISKEKQTWRFTYLLRGRPSLENDENRPILSLPEETLFAWCHAHPKRGPAIVAAILPILAIAQDDEAGRELHPLVQRLLDQFGDQTGVLDGIGGNINTFTWWGSMTNYYALYREPLRTLENHPRRQVRDWAKATLRQVERQIEAAQNEDEEREARWEY